MTITTTRALCGLHGEPLSTNRAGRVLCPVELLDCTTWTDFQPQHDERVRVDADGAVVVDHEDGLYGGVFFDVEQTGGNCTALVYETDDGGHLVVTNGDASHDLSGPVLVARYAVDGWHDGSDPAWTAEGDDADALVRTALAREV